MSLPPLVDEVNLEKFLGSDAPVRAERIEAGHSNLTFLITQGDPSSGSGQVKHYVLRRPPRPPYLPTAHDVLREHRIISALAQTTFPVPRLIRSCDDNSVIGAPFYLMERVNGVVIRNQIPPQFDTSQDRQVIADAVIRTLVALHAIDYNAIGLGNLGKPDGYLARQVKRWIGQLDGARTRDIPTLNEVGEWLQAHIPESPAATLVHGDFRIDNVMFAPQSPPRVVAVLDWEMSTLGDPLADLGYLLSFWREAGEPNATPLPDDMGDVTSQAGFPSRAEIAARYEELSGRKAANLTFYIVLAIWKLAILLEGSYKRHQMGTADDPFFALLGDGVPALAKRAKEVIGN
jgi:aminoglycoside phosphotransferase (APT) family kinase protein